jgi:hypothetical protein
MDGWRGQVLCVAFGDGPFDELQLIDSQFPRGRCAAK